MAGSRAAMLLSGDLEGAAAHNRERGASSPASSAIGRCCWTSSINGFSDAGERQTGLARGELAERIDELTRFGRARSATSSLGRAISIDIYASAELGDRARMDAALERWPSFGEERQRMQPSGSPPRRGDARDPRRRISRRGASSRSEGWEIGPAAHGEQFEGVYGIQMFSIRREQGRLAEVAPVVKRLIADNPDETAWLPGFALIAADLGFEEPARRRLRRACRDGFEMPLDAKRSARCPTWPRSRSLGETESAARIYS